MGESLAIPMGAVRGGRMLPLGEARLARLAAAGDERAFATIYERYHQELFRYCMAILRNPEDAQDALQSTMANALRALPGERRPIALRPWLYRVAHNESLSLIRRRTPALQPDAFVPPELGADIRAEAKERLRQLVTDLRALPERQRGALVMRELSGLGYDEIAAAFEISPGGARQAVYEARVALAELSEGREMECRTVRRSLSDGDGRVLRGRKIRSHLRGCALCTDFQAGVATRRDDLQALCPPLPAVAVSAVLAGLLGGGTASAGAGALAGGTLTGGGTLAGLGGLKSAAVVAAAIAAGGTAAGVTGAVDVPFVGNGATQSEVHRAAPSSPGDAAGAAATSTGPATSPVGFGSKPNAAGDTGQGHGRGHGRGNDGVKGPPAHSNAGGNGKGHGKGHGNDGAGGPPAHSNAGGNGNGVAAGVSDGVTGPPAHSAAGGYGGVPGPPELSNAGGNGNGNGQSAAGSPVQGVVDTIPPGQANVKHRKAK